MSGPFKLFRLQQVDSQLDQANKRLKEIKAALSDNEEVEHAERNLEVSKELMFAAQKKMKRSEEDVQSQQIKIEKNQSRLYSGKVTIPKELQDLQHEEQAFKRNLVKLEDTQLEKMMSFEETDTNHENARESLRKVGERVASQNTDLMDEQSNLLSEVESLESERVTTISGIPPDDLKLYEKLRVKRAGVAVAKVIDKSCSACGSGLPHALAQAARSTTMISLCNTCGRILYRG